MRTLTLLFTLMMLFSGALSAQTAGELLQKVSVALSKGQDDYAVSLFRQSANAGAEQAEMFYLTRVEKGSPVAPRLANELAAYYERKRNYDKAYLFYREYLQYHPEEISALVLCAGVEMMRGKEKEAMRIYEKVLLLDADNLQANIFLGNYFYLQAERDKKKLEEEYKKISSPTRMQHARYRNGLHDIYYYGYAKAKEYLQKVMQLFPSTEAESLLQKIAVLQKEME